ncbi:MAG TPA: hypothetical protein VK868_02305, partial [Pyrinomonadaceae bacterium]|nr:hypothetical protein [Pyrinomonadaceae bacterium]
MLRTSELILNFVLNSCWQIAVIAAIAALASRLLKNGPARYQHALWVFALVISLLVPLLTATRYVPSWISSVQPHTVPSAVAQGRVSNTASQENLSVDHIGTRRTRTVTTTPHRSLSRTRICTFHPRARDQAGSFLAEERTPAEDGNHDGACPRSGSSSGAVSRTT